MVVLGWFFFFLQSLKQKITYADSYIDACFLVYDKIKQEEMWITFPNWSDKDMVCIMQG